METINVGPGRALLQRAIDHFKLEGIIANDNGTFGITTDENDKTKLLSQLTGLMVADYVEETMVFPSNIRRLRETAENLKSAKDMSSYRNMGYDEFCEIVDEVVDAIENVAGNLDPANKEY